MPIIQFNSIADIFLLFFCILVVLTLQVM